jgi:hypothetical protein
MSEIIIFEETVTKPTTFEVFGEEIIIFGSVKIASKVEPTSSPFNNDANEL